MITFSTFYIPNAEYNEHRDHHQSYISYNDDSQHGKGTILTICTHRERHISKKPPFYVPSVLHANDQTPNKSITPGKIPFPRY